MRKIWIVLALAAGIAVLVVVVRGGAPHRASLESASASQARDVPRESAAPSNGVSDAPTAQPPMPDAPGERRPSSDASRAGENEAPAVTRHETAIVPIAPPEGQPSPQATMPAADVPSQVPAPVAPIHPSPGSAPTPPAASADTSTTAPPREEGAPAASSDPESDSRPPVLQFLRFDPAEIKGGGVATLSLQVADDLSGVKSVSGVLQSPSATAVVPFIAQDRSASGVYSATVAIPRQAETGDWFVAVVQAVDKAENALNATFVKATVPQGGTLRVVSDDSDATAPVVRAVTIEKGAVGAGTNNRLVIEVDDDRSGVLSVTGSFQSPSKSAFIPFACGQRDETSDWQAAIPIPANADCGTWTLKLLRVADKANNAAILGEDVPLLGSAHFVVSGGGCDAEPPTIDALFFSPTVVTNTVATEITLTVRAHDDRSGVGSLTGRVEGPVSATGQVPSIYFESAADPDDPGAPLTARIPVPQFAAKGVWRVALVQVTDNARNTRSYGRDDPALADGSFTVE
jgi:hypothetical protein